MGYPTYNVGVSGHASRKLILGYIDGIHLLYSGFGVTINIKPYSFEHIMSLPVQSGTQPVSFTGGEGGIVMPMPPGWAEPVTALHVRGEWSMMVTAIHKKGRHGDYADLILLTWSRKKPDYWCCTSVSGCTKTAYKRQSDTGVLCVNTQNTPILYHHNGDWDEDRAQNILAYWNSYGTSGYSDFNITYPNAIATDKNPTDKFPGEDNTDDPAGGDGHGEVEDDPVEVPEDPAISATASGLLTLYTPTLSQVKAFGSFLWSDLFSLDTFKKLFSDPMQAVIGLSVLPIAVPTSGAQNIIIGSVDSGVSANRASQQFVRKDCGTLKVSPTWNTALDYEPYTKFSIFLPYIGTRELKTDDIMNKDISVTYLIDILSGSCTAHIKVGGSVLYQFSGSCAVPIPVSGTSWNNLLTSAIQLAGAGIVTAASGGAATAALAGGMAAAGTANMVANAKPNIQRTGAVSGAAGMLGVQVPYLIRETPRQSLAKGYNTFVGYPSNITSKLSDLQGFTQVENIHLENMTCTGDEAAEIESLLKEGVII